MEAKQPCDNRFLDDDDLMELLREEEDIIEEKSRESIIGYLLVLFTESWDHNFSSG